MTPLAAVVGGLLAGAVGTVCMDTVRYLRYRQAGGTDSPMAWEFAPVETWDKAPDPGQVAKRVIEGFTVKCRPSPDSDSWVYCPYSRSVAHFLAAAGSAGHLSPFVYQPWNQSTIRLTFLDREDRVVDRRRVQRLEPLRSARLAERVLGEGAGRAEIGEPHPAPYSKFTL